MADGHVLLVLGILMGVALVGGLVGGILRLPKVTSYLLVGAGMGAMASHFFPDLPTEKFIHEMEPLTRLAIALVLFHLGCNFPISRIRRIAGRVLRLSLGELGATFGLVFLGLLVLGASWQIALLLGALALATAPATTILVLKESESEGPVTEYANAMVAVNNLVSIVLFELFFLAILIAGGMLDMSPTQRILMLAKDLAGSVALGIVAGFITSFFYPLVAAGRRLALLVAAVATLLGICLLLEIPYLLAFLAMGVMTANSSSQAKDLLAELDRLTGLLCVVFFVTHGAELRYDKLSTIGLIGGGYLAFRWIGKYLGTYIAAKKIHEEPDVTRNLGLVLFAQAGAAIALADIAVTRTQGMDGAMPGMFLQIQAIILGTVVIFEIIGPLLIRRAVINAGEVPLAQAIYHPGIGIGEQFRNVFNRLLMALGRDPWQGRQPSEIHVEMMMRKNIKPILQTATFGEVVEVIEHSSDNTFPVIDATGSLVGVIHYRELSGALFDPKVGTLIRAIDLMMPTGQFLHAEDSLEKAARLFTGRKDDAIPVVAKDEENRLVGMVRRRDIMKLQIRDIGDATG